MDELDQIRELKNRVKDLEYSLKSVKISIEEVGKIDNSHISFLSFEDGFNHALKLVNGSVEIFINPLIDQ